MREPPVDIDDQIAIFFVERLEHTLVTSFAVHTTAHSAQGIVRKENRAALEVQCSFADTAESRSIFQLRHTNTCPRLRRSRACPPARRAWTLENQRRSLRIVVRA